MIREGKKLRIKMRIKLWKKGKTIVDAFRTKKSTIWSDSERVIWDRGYILVDYGNGFINDSYHTTKESLLNALTAYTEKPLLDYVERTKCTE